MRLKVEHIKKSYNDDIVIDNVSFFVNPGELVGLVGPNGAGKSTTLNMLCGILPADAGKVSVDGFDPSEDPIGFRRKIAFVPERPGLHAHVACYDFLKFTADTHQQPESELFTKAVLAGCRAYLHKPMDTLSRGQRQAVYLAAAFLAEPTLLVLDEPTVGLDPLQQKNILGVLRDFCKQGGSVLLSTHALYEAENVCDRIVVLMDRKIIADGTAEEIARQNQSLYAFLQEAQNGDTDHNEREVC